MAPPLASDSEVSLDVNSLLHRFVSEGNLNGVRLVFLLYFAMLPIILFELSFTFCYLSIACRELLGKTHKGQGGNSVRSLLEAQNPDGQTALHLACRRGSVELVEAILEYPEANVDVLDKDGDPPLVFALAAGSPDCVRALIKRQANVRSRLREGLGPSVAHVCAYHGQPDCMRVGFLFLRYLTKVLG